MKQWYRALAVTASATGLMLCAALTPAAELHWKNRPFSIVADNKKVGDFIRELGASQGLTAVIDPKVTGVISGKFSGSPQATLNTVCATYGLTWYYDGSFLYIDRADEAQTRVFPIPKGSASELGRIMQAMQITDRRFPMVISDTQNTVYVSGPRRYIELVQQALDTLSNPGRDADRAEIRSFPLKYMWASDFVINRAGKEVTVPGVASLLRGMFGLRENNAASPARSMRLSGPTRQMKLGSGDTINVPRIEIPLGPNGSVAGYGGSQLSSNTSLSGGSQFGMRTDNNALPKIEADPANNAVLIRDLPERMGQYQSIIADMDKRPRLLEIDLTIMDISTSSLDKLGIDWRLHTSHGDFQFGDGSNPPLTFNVGNSESGQTGTTTPTGMALTASIGGSLANYLVARVNAMAQNGDAELRATPRVLTLNNTQAVLEDLTTFYVPVNGFQDASLYDVTTGTSVKVTPLIVDNDKQAGSGGNNMNAPMNVMLSIEIDDGNVLPTDQAVQGIPSVEQRSIVTQAMLDEGKSLLIAGFNSAQTSNNKTGIPLLQDIPILGKLFQYTSKSGKHMERFYLLTPRVVVAGSALPPTAIGGAVPDNAMPVYRSPDSSTMPPPPGQGANKLPVAATLPENRRSLSPAYGSDSKP